MIEEPENPIANSQVVQAFINSLSKKGPGDIQSRYDVLLNNLANKFAAAGKPEGEAFEFSRAVILHTIDIMLQDPAHPLFESMLDVKRFTLQEIYEKIVDRMATDDVLTATEARKIKHGEMIRSFAQRATDSSDSYLHRN